MTMDVPYHYGFRVIVVGDTMVGKSSLLKTFSEGSFGEMEPTVGVDFFSKIIKIRPKHRRASGAEQEFKQSIDRSNRDQNHSVSRTNALQSHLSYYRDRQDDREDVIIKLQVWDTAGQERFRSIVTSYYRNSVGIILVYDVTNRESYDHLIDWFAEARRHVEPSPSPTLSPITQNPEATDPNVHFPFTSTPNASPSLRSVKNRRRSNVIIQDSDFSFSNRPRDLAADTSTSSSGFESEIINRNPDCELNRVGQEDVGYKMAYLVLACKTDLKDKRQVSYEDGQAFADMHGFKFIETSSKTHHNVDKAFNILAEEIYDKVSACERANALHRTASGAHLSLSGATQITEAIRIGPLVDSYRYRPQSRLNSSQQLLEAQPVSGFLGGCC